MSIRGPVRRSDLLTAGQIELAARQRTRHALTGLLGLVLVSVVAVGWLALRDPAGRDASARPGITSGVVPTGGKTPSIPSTAASAATVVWVAPARWIGLPAGSGVVDEYPVGFPAGHLGAVAVAVRAVEYGWTLDPALAARVAALYTTPKHSSAAGTRAAAAAEAWRTQLGMTQGRPLGPEVGVAAHPVGVQWRQRGPDRVRVSVLVELATHLSDREPLRQIAAITADVEWVADVLEGHGDWRVQPAAGRLPTPDPAPIGTTEFNTLGWVAIQESR